MVINYHSLKENRSTSFKLFMQEVSRYVPNNLVNKDYLTLIVTHYPLDAPKDLNHVISILSEISQVPDLK